MLFVDLLKIIIDITLEALRGALEGLILGSIGLDGE